MTADESTPLGSRVATLRRRLGLSQVELGARLGRSESWVSQVERGVRSVDRVSVLTRLAQALDVPVTELSPSSAPAAGDDTPEAPYIDELRLLLSGSPGLGVALGDEEPVAVDVDVAHRWAGECWELVHGSRYRELADELGEALPALEVGTRATTGARRRVLQEVLVDLYMAASALLARLDEPEGTWLAGDRAGLLALAVGKPALLAAAQHRLALGLLSTGRTDQARHVADAAVEALKPLDDDAPVELVSAWGALHLVLAVVDAREGQRKLVREHLGVARTAAEIVGPGRNDLHTEFGPANVAAHAVATAVELGDAGEALERAEELDGEQLSPERRARVLLDVARAHDQLRRPADALGVLLEAESLAPEQVHDHAVVREVVRSLLQQAGRRPSADLRGLADRIGVAD